MHAGGKRKGKRVRSELPAPQHQQAEQPPSTKRPRPDVPDLSGVKTQRHAVSFSLASDPTPNQQDNQAAFPEKDAAGSKQAARKRAHSSLEVTPAQQETSPAVLPPDMRAGIKQAKQAALQPAKHATPDAPQEPAVPPKMGKQKGKQQQPSATPAPDRSKQQQAGAVAANALSGGSGAATAHIASIPAQTALKAQTAPPPSDAVPAAKRNKGSKEGSKKVGNAHHTNGPHMCMGPGMNICAYICVPFRSHMVWKLAQLHSGSCCGRFSSPWPSLEINMGADAKQT